MIRVEAVISGRKGFILAIESSDREPGAGYDWDATGTAFVVGQVYRESADGVMPQRWKAWLWPRAGHFAPRGQSVAAITRNHLSELENMLVMRHQAQGAWWSE